LIENQNSINKKMDFARVELAEGVYQLCETVEVNAKKAADDCTKLK